MTSISRRSIADGRGGSRTPVALFIFNRPDTTARVLEAIAAARPAKLLVIADGPRADRPGEAALCEQARAAATAVTWNCEVVTHFADANMGCRRRVSSGLDWVFETVETAIVLEDDCLPHPTFFRFCEELLDRYRDDERIMTISGDNFQHGPQRTKASYYYSRYCHIWGWATWRRAWRCYDVTMRRWPEFRDAGLLKHMLGADVARSWSAIFQAVYDGEIDTWDFQWTFACWTQGALAIIPTTNLVTNLGFRPDATHTTDASHLAELPFGAIEFPLVHPAFFIRDAVADAHTQRDQFGQRSRAIRLMHALKRRIVAATRMR